MPSFSETLRFAQQTYSIKHRLAFMITDTYIFTDGFTKFRHKNKKKEYYVAPILQVRNSKKSVFEIYIPLATLMENMPA